MFDSAVHAQQLTESPIYNNDEFTARRDIVRLAALLHDVGHCIFSHVSEKFYSRDKDVTAAVEWFRNYYESKVTASEAISILIIQSDAFKTLLARSDMRRFGSKDRRVLAQVCACIAGSKTRMAPDCFMAEIVNGPVDCDKLDYLARDAHMAGVPISLDVHRLLSKLRLVRVERETPLYSLAIVPMSCCRFQGHHI